MDVDAVRKLKKGCIQHSKRLLNAARLLEENGYANFAYHLATLALEEVGKSEMIVVGHLSVTEGRGKKILKQAAEDHEKKLFYALWMPYFGEQSMSNEEMQSFADFANSLHITRLRGLYVNPVKDFIEPDKVISMDEAKRLISLVDARVKMEESSDIKEMSKEEERDLAWFEEASEDVEKKKLILGGKSIAKLKDLKGDTLSWVRWLKEQFEDAERKSEDAIRRELQRERPEEGEDMKAKWLVTFRLVTSSHSVRQKVLNSWNSKFEMMKFRLGKKTKKLQTAELIVDLKMPSKVHLKGLWYTGWGAARSLAVALNIATQGYFWWYLPKDVGRFYDKITDLESGAEVGVERKPRLVIDWGKGVLSEQDLRNAAMCWRFLPRDNVEFLNAYVAGISLMGKNDIHTPFERRIFVDFYEGLLSAVGYYENVGDVEAQRSRIIQFFEGMLPGASEPKQYVELGAKSQDENERVKITLTECGWMKCLFDAYVMVKINEIVKRETRREDGKHAGENQDES